MKLSLLVVLAVGVAVASAYPAKKKSLVVPSGGRNEIVLNSGDFLQKKGKSEVGVGDRIRLPVGSRTPRFVPQSYEEYPGVYAWYPVSQKKEYRGNYRVVRPSKIIPRRQLRDSDEDDDEDSAEDDDAEDEEDEEEQNDVLETPTWDELFPPEEQGDYGQAQKNPSFGARRNAGYGQAGVPQGPQPHEISTGELVRVPGRGRTSFVDSEEDDDVEFRGRSRVRTVVHPRQYNFNVGTPQRRQQYYVGTSQRRNWNPYGSYTAQGRRPSWSEQRRPQQGPVYHVTGGRNKYNSYPSYPVQAYRGRSNTFQGRRNTKIPVFYESY